jgi:trans-aconitate methyltransferase
MARPGRPQSLSVTLAALWPRLASRASWNREYARGDWDVLESEDEAPRYQAIAAIARRLPRPPRVLDVGCGEGWLYPALARELVGFASAGHYHGIDLSDEALRRASARLPPDAVRQQADAARFVPTERYDLIVLNEILNYLPRPLEVLARLGGALEPGGLMIVSLFDYFLGNRVGRAIDAHHGSTARPVETVEVRGGRGLRWRIRVLPAQAKRTA